MRSKLMLMTTVFLLTLQLDFQAATIYASDGTVIDSNTSICANDTYTYETDSNDMFEAEIVSTANNMLQTTLNASNGVIEFEFPANVDKLTAYIYDYTDEGRNLADSYDFTVTDCGYESVVEDYNVAAPLVTFKKSEQTVTFTAPEADNYKLYINQIEENDDQQSKQVKFKDGVADVEVTTDMIQLTETYTDKEGSEIEKFYEVDFTDKQIIRNVKDLQLSVIEPLNYIDVHILLRVLGGLIVLIILYLINLKLLKQYRSKKRYKQRMNEMKAKRREQLVQAKKEQELEKKSKIDEKKSKQKESERLANLENTK